MKPAIVIQTDFSRNSSAVATMYGVCQTVDPSVRLFDLTHGIPPFDIFAASHVLRNTTPFWPEGTLFISVVDPGVGTDRRGCVALLRNGQYVVTPDNGTLTHVLRSVGIEAVREIDRTVNRWPTTLTCDIFHGRDVFAYTAIRLASGIIDFEGVGPPYPVGEIITIPFDEPVYEGGCYRGVIESSGPYFGLVSSNIPDRMFFDQGARYGDRFLVEIQRGGEVHYRGEVSFRRSFGYVEKGEPVLFVGATATIQIALREENITERYKIGEGPDWRISLRKVGPLP